MSCLEEIKHHICGKILTQTPHQEKSATKKHVFLKTYSNKICIFILIMFLSYYSKSSSKHCCFTSPHCPLHHRANGSLASFSSLFCIRSASVSSCTNFNSSTSDGGVNPKRPLWTLAAIFGLFGSFFCCFFYVVSSNAKRRQVMTGKSNTKEKNGRCSELLFF